MKARDFCYWLQGYFELASPEGLTKEQIEAIKNHLSMVFTHEIDPSFPASQQEKLNQQHSGSDVGGGWGTKPDGWHNPEPGARC